MTPQNAPETTRNWRNNWLAVNILVKIPIVRSFVENRNLSSAIYDASECVAGLSASVMIMMQLPMHETDSYFWRSGQMAVSMIVGTPAGRVPYSGFCSGVAMLYNYSRARANFIAAASDEEMLAISSEIPATATAPRSGPG